MQSAGYHVAGAERARKNALNLPSDICEQPAGNSLPACPDRVPQASGDPAGNADGVDEFADAQKFLEVSEARFEEVPRGILEGPWVTVLTSK
eukprot:6568697-Pyramimonas_sp.AAC.1